jgi:alpha-beta hydrolase superfamily lysophospholipase
VEDTNALALEFNKIAKANGRDLAAPSKTYITGHSMGGHITAAAIEDEAFATANHKMKYNGAVPMCGVLGDTELFDYFAGATRSRRPGEAGLPKYPTPNWADIGAQVTARCSPASRHPDIRHGHRRRSLRLGGTEPDRRRHARCSTSAWPPAVRSRRCGACSAATARSTAS